MMLFVALLWGCFLTLITGTIIAKLKQNILDKIKTSSINSGSLTELEYLNDVKLEFPGLYNSLDGIWALIYSNRSPNLMTTYQEKLLQRTINNSIPFFSVYKFNNVIQRIDSTTKTIDHILSYDGSKLSLPSLKIILNHEFDIVSQSCPATIGLYLNKVNILINNRGVLSLPLLPIGPKELKGGYFETTYCDDDFRISRGLFDEIRIFKKIPLDSIDSV